MRRARWSLRIDADRCGHDSEDVSFIDDCRCTMSASTKATREAPSNQPVQTPRLQMAAAPGRNGGRRRCMCASVELLHSGAARSTLLALGMGLMANPTSARAESAPVSVWYLTSEGAPTAKSFISRLAELGKTARLAGVGEPRRLRGHAGRDDKQSSGRLERYAQIPQRINRWGPVPRAMLASTGNDPRAFLPYSAG
jgi:hypothetical protein